MDLMIQPGRSEAGLSKEQKAFNRLLKKLERSQKKLQQLREELSECLAFYNDKIRPATEKTNEVLTEAIHLFYGFYKKPRLLNKKEKKTLHDLIENKITEVFSEQLPKDFDPQLLSIYREVTGSDFLDQISDTWDRLSGELKDLFGDRGVDLDIPEFDASDDIPEMQRKLLEALQKGTEGRFEAEQEPLKKTKRQLNKEQRAGQLEELQKKGISSIYRRLVKALHPDAEQDPAIKMQKEALMTKLTTAYELRDLQTMLWLESEWIRLSGVNSVNERFESDEVIKVYNSLLKDQIAAIEDAMIAETLDLRYVEVHRYLTGDQGRPMAILADHYRQILSQRDLYSTTVRELKGPYAVGVMRNIIDLFDEALSDYFI